MKRLMLLLALLAMVGCAAQTKNSIKTQTNSVGVKLNLTSPMQQWTEDEWEALGRDWKECYKKVQHDPIPHPGFIWIPVFGSFWIARKINENAERCMQEEKGWEVQCDYHFITFYGSPTLIRREK